MEDSEPAKSTLPKAPIPVEESRAQRLQRSQARFRDRGGIFVPTARNTLVDILLGRKVASPKKRRGRSASLSPKKKSMKSGTRDNDDQVKAVRTSPRKAIQMNEPEAGPSENHDQGAAYKPKTTKKFTKEATMPAKVKKNNEKPATKKRGRKPKTAVQEADTTTDHDPPPLAKPRSPTKKAVTKKVPKVSKPEGDLLAGNASGPEPERSAKATKAAKPLPDGVMTEDDVNVKNYSRTSTSKKPTTSKRKTAASVNYESELAPLQQSSTAASASHSRKASDLEDDRRTNEAHQESSKESTIAKGKRKGKAPQSVDPGENPDVTALEAPHKSRKKRSRPAEPEIECPSQPKRMKQTPSEEAKPTAPRKKAPTANKENKGTVLKRSKDTSSKLPLSTKRARGPANERTDTKRKKAKGVDDADTISDGPIDEQVVNSKEEIKKSKKPEKAKKLPASKTSRVKKGTAKAPDQDEVGTIENSFDWKTDTSKFTLSTKRAREPDDERTDTKRKKVKGVDYADQISDGPIDEQVVNSKEEIKKSKKPGKAKKSPASETSRVKKGAAKASDHDESSFETKTETKTEPGVVFVTRIRPRKSVIMRMKQPQPDQLDDDPDPIDFLC